MEDHLEDLTSSC